MEGESQVEEKGGRRPLGSGNPGENTTLSAMLQNQQAFNMIFIIIQRPQGKVYLLLEAGFISC